MTAVIQGTVTINGAAPVGARAVLINETTGVPISSVDCDGAGHYSFSGMAAGLYAIAIIDKTGNYRGKVIHTEILPILTIVGTLPHAVLGIAYSQRLSVINVLPVGSTPSFDISAGAIPPWMSITWHADTQELEFHGTPA
jgi:hypothetical protein